MIEENKTFYNPEHFYETNSGGKINKKSLIKGSNKINLTGKVLFLQKLVFRGDLACVTLGKYVVIQEGATVRPPYRVHKGKVSFLSVQIHDYVMIRQNAIIQAASIGNCVDIGNNCVVGQRAVILDNVKLLDDSVVPPDSVLTSFGIYAGKPARLVGELHESWTSIQKLAVNSFYSSFVPKKRRKTELPSAS